MEGGLDFGQFAQFLNILRIRLIIHEERELAEDVTAGCGCGGATTRTGTSNNKAGADNSDSGITEVGNINPFAPASIPKPLDNAGQPDPKVALNIRCKKCRKLETPCDNCIAASSGTL